MRGQYVYCVMRDVGGRYALRLELVSIHTNRGEAKNIVDKKNANQNTPFTYHLKRKQVK